MMCGGKEGQVPVKLTIQKEADNLRGVDELTVGMGADKLTLEMEAGKLRGVDKLTVEMETDKLTASVKLTVAMLSGKLAVVTVNLTGFQIRLI